MLLRLAAAISLRQLILTFEVILYFGEELIVSCVVSYLQEP